MTSAARTTAAGLLIGLVLLAVPNGAAATIPGGFDQGAVVFESRQGGSDADLFMRTRAGQEQRLAASVVGAEDSRASWAPEPVLGVHGAFPEAGGLRVAGSGFKTPDYFVPGAPTVVPAVVMVMVDGHEIPAGGYEVTSDEELVVSAVPPPGTGDTCVRKRAGMALAPTFTVTSQVLGATGLALPNELGVCPTQPIAFQSNRTGDYEIYLYDPALPVEAGVNPINVSRSPGSQDTAPTWSSAASSEFKTVRPSPLIAYVSDRDGDRNIYVLDPARPLSRGGAAPNPQPLTTDVADDANPDWAADGSGIVFESTRAGVRDIWTLDVGNGPRYTPENNLRHVTVDTLPAYDPVWYSDTGPGNTPTAAIAFVGPEDSRDGPCQLQLVTWAGGPPPIAAGGEQTSNGHADEPAFLPFGDAISATSVQGGPQADLWSYPVPDESGPALPAWFPLLVRAGAEGHPNWQATPWPAVVQFHRPRGRASRRKKRGSHGAAVELAAAGRPCAAPPTAAFASAPRQPRAGRRTRLGATASSDSTGPIAAYEWDLDGDGKFEIRRHSPTLRRVFRRLGTRNVALRVVDRDGDSARVQRQITVVNRAAIRRCARRAGARATVIAGTSGRNRLRGTRGHDVICGFGGGDVIRGLGGDDLLFGDRGPDRVFGARGKDRLRGGPGRDRLFGGRGRDVLLARDGRIDRVRGGPQRDTARADRRDDVAGVERVRR